MTRMPRGAAQLKWRRQRQEKSRRWPTLNLVALMDAFTILVFFFLANSTGDTPQAYDGFVKLPESVADQPPRDTPILTITRDHILLQGEAVATIDATLQESPGVVKALHIALQAQLAPDAGKDEQHELTIMGDRSTPFEVLNRVMHICTQAGYSDIALSVLQRPTGAG